MDNNISDEEFLNSIIASPEFTNTNFKQAVTFEDNPDEKCYLLLLSVYPDDTEDTSDSYKDWVVKIGRQVAYDYLKDMVSGELIDPNESYVIAGSKSEDSIHSNFKPTSEPITVFRFMKVMVENHKVLDDRESFDINEYKDYDGNGDKTILEI